MLAFWQRQLSTGIAWARAKSIPLWRSCEPWGDELFPIDVEFKTISEFLEGDTTVVSLDERWLIRPVSIVYEALAKSGWKYRERVLKKWVETHTLGDIGELPHLLSYDLAPIVAASSSWGSWLAAAVQQTPLAILTTVSMSAIRLKSKGK